MQDQLNQPAFPPQWAMDSLQRVVAPITGMTKLEYLSAQFLPYFLGLARQTQLAKGGEPINSYQAAVEAAKFLLETIHQQEKKTDIQPV
jgi:hypothetical protein